MDTLESLESLSIAWMEKVRLCSPNVLEMQVLSLDKPLLIRFDNPLYFRIDNQWEEDEEYEFGNIIDITHAYRELAQAERARYGLAEAPSAKQHIVSIYGSVEWIIICRSVTTHQVLEKPGALHGSSAPNGGQQLSGDGASESLNSPPHALLPEAISDVQREAGPILQSPLEQLALLGITQVRFLSRIQFEMQSLSLNGALSIVCDKVLCLRFSNLRSAADQRYPFGEVSSIRHAYRELTPEECKAYSVNAPPPLERHVFCVEGDGSWMVICHAIIIRSLEA